LHETVVFSDDARKVRYCNVNQYHATHTQVYKAVKLS